MRGDNIEAYSIDRLVPEDERDRAVKTLENTKKGRVGYDNAILWFVNPTLWNKLKQR